MLETAKFALYFSSSLDNLKTEISNISFFIVYSPRLNRTKHRQEGQNSGRLSPSGSFTSGRSSPSGAKKPRTLPGVPGRNQTSGKEKYIVFFWGGGGGGTFTANG